MEVQDTQTNMVLVAARPSDTIMAPRGGPALKNLHGSHGNRAADINIDPGCYRAMDLEMGLGSGLDPDDTMDPSGRTGHSDRYGPSCSMAPGLQQGHRLWPRS